MGDWVGSLGGCGRYLVSYFSDGGYHHEMLRADATPWMDDHHHLRHPSHWNKPAGIPESGRMVTSPGRKEEKRGEEKGRKEKRSRAKQDRRERNQTEQIGADQHESRNRCCTTDV